MNTLLSGILRLLLLTSPIAKDIRIPWNFGLICFFSVCSSACLVLAFCLLLVWLRLTAPLVLWVHHDFL